MKRCAEAAADAPVDRAVVGRPVYFVDDDAERDAQAEAALRSAAASAGFREIVFQYEPIAAAFDHEQAVTREEKVLVADIGGGTSDFSLVRVGPERKAKVDRKADILANHGVHIAGTDFDRRIELASILPLFGYGAYGPSIDGAPPREVPSAVYFDLATWHLINTVYNPQRVVELRGMRSFYADAGQHRRLMTVVTEHYGHDLVARAEAAKIAVAGGGRSTIDLGHVEAGLASELDEAEAARALDADLDRIVAAARATVAQAGLEARAVDALYLTGGSTGLDILSERLRARLPRRPPRPRRPLRQRRDRPGAVRAASLRRPGPTLTVELPPCRRAADAAVASVGEHGRHRPRGRVDVAAVQPGDAHPPGAQHVDRELLAQAIDLARRQAGVAEHAALAEEVAEVATRHLRGENAVQRVAHRLDALAHRRQLGLPSRAAAPAR